MQEKDIKFWKKFKLTKECLLTILYENGKYVNLIKHFEVGTVITFTGGGDTSYYLRLGELQEPQITIPQKEIDRIEISI